MQYSSKRLGLVALSATPSMLYNNLTCNGSKAVFAHRGKVVSFDESAVSGTSAQQQNLEHRLTPSKVFTVKWCHIRGRDYLAIGTGSGFIVYKDDLASCIYSYELLSSKIEFPDAEAAFVRGISAVPGTSQICAGSSNGSIFVFSVDGDSIELTQTIPPHPTDRGACTSSIGAKMDHVAVASDSGSLMLLNASENYTETAFFTYSAPCTCVAVSDKFIMAGYATGMLRILRIDSGSMYAEIGGHTRSVMSIDVHPDMPQFISVGLDSVLTVWNMPSLEAIDNDDAEVHASFTDLAEDAPFVGAQFSRDGMENIIVSCYDQKHIRVYKAM